MPYKAVYPGTSPYDPDDEVDFSSAISGMYETFSRKGALELKIDVDKTRRFYKALRFISGTVTNPDNALWTETATSAFFRSVKGSVKVTSSAGAASVKASVTVTLSNGGKRNGDVKIVLKRSAGKWVCDVTISIEGRQKTFNSVAKKSDHFRDVTLDIDYVEKVYWPTIELKNYKGVGGKMKERKLDLFSVFEDAGLKLHYNEEDSQEVKDPTSKTAWTKGDMYVVMEKFFQENTSSDDNIWCLQATQPPDSRYMGYSFDQDGKHGFGIFTGHKSFTGLESSVTKLKSEASRRFLHYMAHECGHCMGLRHPFEEGNPNSLSWMNYAWKYDSKFSPGSFYQNFKFSFSDKELEILRHQPDQLFKKAYKQESHKSYEYQSAPKSVVPDFTGYANEEDGEVPPSSKIRKLQFDIKFRSKPYTKGDVVEFEAILKNVGKLPIKVETDLTPGGGVLTVYVTDPFGNVQIVKPFVHGISAPTRSYTTIGKPGSKTDSEIYSETIPLVQSSHGSLFKSEGKYHVKALYDGGSVKATSKSVPLVIEADDDNDDDTNTEVRIGAGLDGNVSQSFSKLQAFWENLSKKPVEAKTKRFQTIVMLLQGLGVGSVKVTENGRSGRRQKRKPKTLERTDPLVSYSKLIADTDDLMKYYETSDGLEASNYSQLALARGKILMQLNDQERADREYNQMISTLVRKEEEYGFVKRISTEWESVRYPEMQKEKKADVKYYQTRVESLINWVPDDRSDNYDDASGIGLNNAFNGFDTDHREKAETFISELERMEEETDDLDAVLDYADARQRSREVNDIMYRYVIEAYMVHSKLCKKNHVRYPDPPKMDPSVMQSAAMTGSGVGVGVPEELWMNYWRCDADFNFHHNHWHAVYRGSWDLYYRQGELFGYMHAQMLARYDADRESWGLDPVKEYKFDEKEPDGFDAGFEFHNKYGWMVPRPKEQVWPEDILKENQENEKKIWKCFDEGLVEYDDIMLPMDTNIAGHIIEASSGNFRRNLGSFHNMGHMAFCYTEEMKKKGRDITTYMGSPLCAVRDPIFFRWHKHVDNLYQYWNNKVKTDLKENAPPVIIDPCDVIMVPGREMPKDFEKWGGNDWMKTDFSNGEIQTTLKKAELAFEWDYKLGHEEFTYFLRLKRKPGTEGELRLTLRLFICKEEHMNNRRRWIEMDKFVHIMPAKMEQCVVKRLDRESSVIKRSHDATNESDEAKQPSIEIKQGNCDCGWPYSMLLPRGDKNGEKWLLGVYVSDANNDEINVCASCGSMSYCGTEDQVYPDKMIMGYPFATPMAINDKVVSISDAASQLDNFCITPFTIRNDHPFVKPAPVIPPILMEEEEDTPLPLYSPLNVLGEFSSSGYSRSRLTGRLRVLLDDTDFHQMGVERVRVVFKGRSDQAYNITNVRIALRMGNTLNIDPKCNVDVKFKGANEAEVPMDGLMSDELVLPVKTGGENDYWLTFTLGSPGCFGLAENHNRTNTYRLNKNFVEEATINDDWEMFQEHVKQFNNIYCVDCLV